MSGLLKLSETEEKSLLEQYGDSFESLYLELTENCPIEEQREIVENMTKLLTISEENMGKITSEKWFQRVWYGVTRKNKKLRQINQKNLLTVQKMSAVFLENYAVNNRILSVSVKAALERLDNSDVQHAKIKQYLLEWTRRNNNRNKSFEHRLEALEKKAKIITKPNYIVRIWHKIISFLTGKTYVRESLIYSNIEEISDSIKNKNKNILTQVKVNIEKFFMLFIEDNSYASVEFIFENDKKYIDFIENIESSGKGDDKKITPAEYAKMLENIILYQPINVKLLDENVVSSVNWIVDHVQELTKGIITDYIPESSSRLIADIPYSDKLRISESCTKQLASFKVLIEDFEAKRQKVNSLFPRINTLYNRNGVENFIKEFGEGLIPLWGQFRGWIDEPFFKGKLKQNIAKTFGVKTDQDYIDEFFDALSELLETYDNIKQQSVDSVYSVVKNECQSYIKSWMYNYDDIFEEFSNYNVDLELLNQECINAIAQFESENDSGNE